MSDILLTQYNGVILGPIAKLIGIIINFLYVGLSSIGIENIGITIIIFTLVVYLLMFPITYKQQKFSKLTAKMNPEIKAIQKKYEGKKDQNSRLAMNEETQSVYDKYGVSPTGSCLPLLIQFPLLMAVYRVVYNVPAYVSFIKDTYATVVNGIMGTNGYVDSINGLVETLNIKNLSLNLDGTETEVYNSIVDVLYKVSNSGWDTVRETFPALTDDITSLQAAAHKFNYFLGLDIASSPWQTVKTSFANGSYLIMLLAIILPLFSGFTQWLNLKLSMSSQDRSAMDDNPAMKQMQSMNTFMPIFSIFMVFTLPMGIGLYWIAGALVRSVQQLLLNRHFDKLDFDKIIEDNKEKAAKKRAKREGYSQAVIQQAGQMRTRNVNASTDNEEAIKKAEELKSNAKAGSMASKANLVRDYNNRNNNQN